MLFGILGKVLLTAAATKTVENVVPKVIEGAVIGSGIINSSTSVSTSVGSKIVRDTTEKASEQMVINALSYVVSKNQEKELKEIQEKADKKIQETNSLVSQTNEAYVKKVKDTNWLRKSVYENCLIPAADIIRQMNVYSISDNKSIIGDVNTIDSFKLSIDKCKAKASFIGLLSSYFGATSSFAGIGFGAGYNFGLHTEIKKAETELAKIEVECEKANIECTNRKFMMRKMDMTNEVVIQLTNYLRALYMRTTGIINTKGYMSYWWTEDDKNFVRSFCNVSFALADIISADLLTQDGKLNESYIDAVNEKKKIISQEGE